MLTLNSYPYFDDYDPTKGYHKILFNPAKPVQARELTQIQSILQEQIKRHGDHVFKNGTIVIPGHVFYDDKVKYLKLETVYNQTNIESYLSQMVGKTVKGDTNGITALMLHYDVKTSTDPTTIYIKYTSAAGTVKEFLSAETLTCPEIPGLTFKVSPVTSYSGAASIATVNDGVYYINGYFAEVLKQSVTVSKYNNTASAVVGLDYVESIVTENEDATLFDNAFGFSNYGAPGAHRLKITLTLGVKPYDYTAADTTEIKFIDLLKVKNGNIEFLKNNTQYAEIEKWLARRTYDESGNYVTKPFTFAAYHYRNNDRGQWVTNRPYLTGDVVTNSGKYYIALNQGYAGATGPTQTYGVQSDGVIYWDQITSKVGFVNGGKANITSTLIDDHINAEKNFLIETSPGKAYVKGFEVEFNSPTASLVPKARTTRQLSNAQIYAPAGTYVTVNNVKGMPNVTTNLTSVNLLSVAGTTIGTAWVRSLEYSTGDLTTPATVEYRLFLFGIAMKSGKSFAKDVHSVSSTVFTADIKPTLVALSGSASAATSTTVTGVGSYFDFDLAQGDRVKVGSTWVTVSSINSPTEFIASAAVTAAAGSTIYKGTSTITKLGEYVKELPSKAINTLRDTNGSIDMQYDITKYYAITTVGTTYAITLTGGETFLPSNHIVILDTGTVGTSLPVNATYSLDPTATTLTIGGLAATTNYKILVRVKRTGSFAKEKTKTVATKTLTLTNSGTQLYTNKSISLTEADCIRIIKITESGDPTDKANYVASGETDITKHFKFDNGQRAEYYDVGRVTTNRSNTRPIRITFEYFVHSTGDYFSADSYSSVPKAMIAKTKINEKEFYLPDCLDFRSRIADSGTNFDTAGGASISDPLLSDMTMSTSYSYFLPRTDTFGIDESGKLIYNIDSEFGNGMILATIDVNAYTKDPASDVKFTDDQITTFTMKDIKNIDNRVANVEYYVALSNLEKNTVNMSIKDQFGLEVDKNGFIVDEFKNHDVTDLLNGDFKASIDYVNKECRALSTLDGVHLVEPIGITDAARSANGYQITGSLITLPYVEEAMISQTLASRAEIVQAYASLDFTGQMIVYPDSESYTTDQYNTVTTQTVATPVTNVVNTTSYVYGGWYGYWWYGYNNGYRWVWDSTNGWHYQYVQPTTTTTSSSSTSTTVTADYWTNYSYGAPLLRERNVVVAARKLKPFTTMNVFLSGNDVNANYVPATMVQISSVGTFLGYDTNQQNDKMSERTTTVNSYDVIQRGDVITCTTGSAVVVADETIYDKATATNKRILYVVNVKGTISGTVTGSVSLATGTVIAVTAGTRESNSLGNFYGAIHIPGFTFGSGNHKVFISDNVSADPNASLTMADAGYSSNGIINTHTRHVNYESKTTTTIVNNTQQYTYGWWGNDG